MPSTLDQVRNARLKLLFEKLDAAGIMQVKVDFDGAGDSGQINEINAIRHGGEDIELIELPQQEITWVHGKHTWGPARIADAPGNPPVALAMEEKWSFNPKTGKLYDLLEDIVYDYMDQEHAGWENNDGAYGEFVFDVQEKTIRYEHNTRFTDSSLDTHEYRLEE
jgi:hypothetical protein